MSLIAELRRRNIFKVGLLYIVAGWVLLQLADLLFAPIGIPDWVYRFAFGMLVICFPLALVFSWIFEITPHGIKRESEVTEGDSITRRTGRRINKITVILLLLLVALTIVKYLVTEPASNGNGPAQESSQAAGQESTHALTRTLPGASLPGLSSVSRPGHGVIGLPASDIS
jgi:hypothetical protein